MGAGYRGGVEEPGPSLLQRIAACRDLTTGERAVAFVTLKPGRSLSFAEMQSFLAASGLARQKFPEELHIVDALPTNSIGKVLKSELKALATASGPAPTAR